VHDDDQDRPPSVFHNLVSLHFGGGHTNRLLLPVIPAKP